MGIILYCQISMFLDPLQPKEAYLLSFDHDNEDIQTRIIPPLPPSALVGAILNCHPHHGIPTKLPLGGQDHPCSNLFLSSRLTIQRIT